MEKLAEAIWRLRFELDWLLFDEPSQFTEAQKDDIDFVDALLSELHAHLTSEFPTPPPTFKDRYRG